MDLLLLENWEVEFDKTLIEKYFGNWENQGPRPDTDLPPVPTNKTAATVSVPNKRRVQDKVILAEMVGFI